jgi:hypothetical protein
MSVEGNFPYEDMDHETKSFVFEACGGRPPTQLSDLNFFFSQVSQPMINDSNPFVKHLLEQGARACANIFDDIDVETGVRFFKRGSLFYAGILGWLGTVNRIPFESEVYNAVRNTDPNELVVFADRRLREDIPVFRSFLSEFASVLEASKSIEYHLVIAGAGLVHIIAKDSLLLEEERLFEERFVSTDMPELDDLEARFREIENEGMD